MRTQIPRFADIDWYRQTRGPARIHPAIAEAARQIQWHADAERPLQEQAVKGDYAPNPDLSWSDLIDFALEEGESGCLREAGSETAQAQLLRVGASSISYGWYLQWQTTWQEIALEDQMNNRMAFHNPIQSVDMPRPTGAQSAYRRTNFRGLDIELIAEKFMSGIDIENELFEDDQSGQINGLLQKLGQAAARFEDAFTAGRLNGAAFVIGDDTYPATSYAWRNSEGTTGTGPYNIARYGTGRGNRPAAYSALDYPGFALAYHGLRQARDIKGQKMMVKPDLLVTSTTDTLNADVLLQSEFLAYIAGKGGKTLSDADSGTIGGQFSKNIVKNYVNRVVTNLYLADWEWYLGCSKIGLIFGRRSPVEIMQEAPNAGASFRYDLTSYRSKMRFTVDWVDSSFWWQGDDGSVAGSF